MNESREATRSRLLTATLEVLDRRGLAGATSREIAAAAGVNLQAITYHFGSKDELVAEVLVHAVRMWTEPIQSALAGVAEDPLGRLLEAVMAAQQALEETRRHIPTYAEALAAATRNDKIRARIAGLLTELRDALATSISELRDAGHIAAWVDPESMAALLIAAGDGFVLHSALDPDSHPADRMLQQAVQLLLAARNPDT